MMRTNWLKCRYCPFVTQRFRGKKTYDQRGMSYGERQLRWHVGQEHTHEYHATQGLAAQEIENSWTLDTKAPLGEQAL